MNIRFDKLFTVAVDHAFHPGVHGDLQLLLPADTRRALARGKLLVREKDGVLHVLVETDEAGDPLVRLDATTLRFGIRLHNPYFTNFTALPADFPARKLYFHNHVDPTQLVADDPFVLLPSLFSHVPSAAARPVTVSLRNTEGVVVASDTLAAADARTSIPFDLRRLQPGPLELREEFPASTNMVLCYLDPEYGPLDLAGIIEVDVAQSFYDVPADLFITFGTLEQTLRYYVVARNYTQTHFNQLDVRDNGFNEDDRDEVEFQRVAASSFTAAELPAALLAPLPDQRVALFRSTIPVPRTGRARRKIQLVRQNEVLIENLPQPSASMAGAELVIHVSKP